MPKTKNSGRHGGDILVIRIIACVIILLMALFVRFSNQYAYDSLKFWYKENISEEKIDFTAIKENISNACLPVKNKIYDLFAYLNSADK